MENTDFLNFWNRFSWVALFLQVPQFIHSYFIHHIFGNCQLLHYFTYYEIYSKFCRQKFVAIFRCLFKGTLVYFIWMIIQRAKSEVWMFCYTRFSIRNQKMASNASQRKSYKSLEEIHLNPQGSKQGLEVGNYWKGFLTFLLENKSFWLRNNFFVFKNF